MRVIPTRLAGLLVIEPDIHRDARGFFMEIHHARRYQDAGIREHFVQDNLSFSLRGTLRGLHFQIRRPQAKLVQAIQGEVFDVAVDLRAGSPTFGAWEGVRLDQASGRQLLVPAGFAHGFSVLSATAVFLYKCSDFYDPQDEGGLLWSDPDLGIAWPLEAPTVSAKDAALPRLAALGPQHLPRAAAPAA